MKYFRFSEPLPELILSGKKTSTWRINDEKNIVVGDVVPLWRKDGSEFAKAKIISVDEVEFGNLSDEDKKGHETFSSDEEMYSTYSRYYKMKVTPKTKVKVFKFVLLDGNA
ncbi:ASCH domain-containing protein [Candidatus Woesearchaeota archaeon]|nr:ASCH domain-containing protein [Candidatus Woesearchaeota archaeon]MBW3016620.1 ASCH domain-containing protein [Candidatus Woesearchaeota archaeon]